MFKSFFQLISLGLCSLMLSSLLMLYSDPNSLVGITHPASTASPFLSPEPRLVDFQNSPLSLRSLPGVPMNLVVRGGINKLDVSWTSPTHLGAGLMGYLISYIPGPGPEDVDPTVTSVHYTLNPGTYTVSIAAVSMLAVGPSVTATPVVVQAPPPPPLPPPTPTHRSAGTSRPVAPVPVHYPAPSSTHIISGVKIYYQTHSLSCEETATSMALTHQGIYRSQDQILASLGVDSTPAVLQNGYVVSWGDPDKAFVGNVNGSENNYTGQQANPKALMRVLNSYGAQVIDWSEPGVSPHVISVQEIYNQVLANHPVVAYATWDWQWHRVYYYTSEDGNRIPLISPWDDHVYTVIGVSSTSVLVNDPIRGQYWVSKASFAAAYSDFNMAIVFA